ncbi:uncharacterized protein ACRADG_005706 [Cochliomyia hominivorax]
MYQTHDGQPNYKRTTDKQYCLLKQKMALYQQQCKISFKNGASKHKLGTIYWADLTDKLNKIGPPYRTVQQWKKVWSDYKRSESRRKSKTNAEIQSIRAIKMQSSDNNVNTKRERDQEYPNNEAIETDYPVKPMIKSEIEDYEENSDAMQMTYVNDYGNDYSYDDEQSMQEHYGNITNESVIPDESSCNSYNYAPPDMEDNTQHSSINQHNANIDYNTPPPLKPSNFHRQDQKLNTLQNQMQHQTKLLEHMSQMSSTIASLMQRQTEAIEKQTIAILRQASATEKHTMVMNTFLDMIQTKMQKGNLPKSNNSNASTTNLDNDIL